MRILGWIEALLASVSILSTHKTEKWAKQILRNWFRPTTTFYCNICLMGRHVYPTPILYNRGMQIREHAVRISWRIYYSSSLERKNSNQIENVGEIWGIGKPRVALNRQFYRFSGTPLSKYVCCVCLGMSLFGKLTNVRRRITFLYPFWHNFMAHFRAITMMCVQKRTTWV